MVASRRKKTATETAATTTTTTSTTNTEMQKNDNDNDDDVDDDEERKQKLKEQLDRAEEAVRTSRDTTATLHVWWRQHLFRLNLLIFLLVFHQAQTPSSLCVQNIKIANQLMTDHTIIGTTPTDESSLSLHYSLVDAMVLVFQDSMMEIMGLICIAALAFFLSSPLSGFENVSYMISTLFVPIQLSLYYQLPSTIGCIHVLNDYNEQHDGFMETEPQQQQQQQQKRSFPIAIIFHTIVTMCIYFMSWQMQHRTDQIKAVLQLKHTLMKAEAAHAAASATSANTESATTTTTTSTTVMAKEVSTTTTRRKKQ